MSGKTISMYMWGYQSHFRSMLEYWARSIITEIAPTLVPEVLLIGVRVPDKEDGHMVCVEPEEGEWDTNLFVDCYERASELYRNHEGHKRFYGDAASSRDKPENIRKNSVLRAVREVFVNFDDSYGTITFCGSPERIGGYHVICAIQVNKEQFQEYPSLKQPIEYDGFMFSGGFLDLVIAEILEDARKSLWSPDPGRYLNTFSTDVDAIYRRAGDRFCSVLTLATKDLMFQGVFYIFNRISSLLYEGDEGVGRLVLAAEDHKECVLCVEFKKPVRLDNFRWARKILEMGVGDLCCMCSGTSGIRGLSSLPDDSIDGIFIIEFTGHFRWQLHHKGKILLKSSFGVPSIPRSLIKESNFRSTFRRLFSDVDELDMQKIWTIVQAALRQQHGTMLVISENAEKEALRLRSQSTPIVPVILTEELVQRVSGIDGAILIDKHGTCWSLGVILDGVASEQGDPARGARFNSAVRYLATQGKTPTLLLVFSEDGTVDMLPTLRPQVARSSIEHHIRLLKKCSFDNFHKTRNWLRDHAFYLNAEQCNLINSEISRIESAPRDLSVLHVETGVFKPHPDMDESYFIEESPK